MGTLAIQCVAHFSGLDSGLRNLEFCDRRYPVAPTWLGGPHYCGPVSWLLSSSNFQETVQPEHCVNGRLFGLVLFGSRQRSEGSGVSGADVFVDSFVEDAIIGFSALFTSHLSSLVLRFERRLLHWSVAHYGPAYYCKGSSKNPPKRKSVTRLVILVKRSPRTSPDCELGHVIWPSAILRVHADADTLDLQNALPDDTAP